MLIENTPQIDDPPSPIQRHVKWKLARTKRYGQMTSQAAQEISDKIVSESFIFYLTNLLFKKKQQHHCEFMFDIGLVRRTNDTRFLCSPRS